MFVEHDAAVDEMPEQGVGDRGGLLGDLLEHEVVVAALLCGGQIPVDVKRPSTVGLIVAVEVDDPVAVGGDHHRLVLAEFDGVTGVFDERRDVGTDERLPVTDPHHQWRGPPGGDDGARITGMREHQGEVALEAAQHRQRGGDEITGGRALAVGVGHQVHRDLAVGVTGELHPGRFELGAQHREVLDDPVVHDGELAGGVAMRMGVAVGGTAVGRPPGVAHARRPDEGILVGFGQRLLQVGQSAGAPADRQPAVAVQNGQPRGVIAAVLHPTQCVHHDVAGRAMPDVRHDSAHNPPG